MTDPIALANALECAAKDHAIATRATHATHLLNLATMLRATPERRRPVVAAAIQLVYPYTRHPKFNENAARKLLMLSSQPYPYAFDNLAKLVLGVSPKELSGGLTAAEAHKWLSSQYAGESPATWLLAEHDLGMAGAVSSVAVARWVVECSRDWPRWDALTKVRTERDHHGNEVCGSYLQRVDELRDSDLSQSVNKTFRACAERLAAEYAKLLEKQGDPLNTPPHWWAPIRCATLLLTGAQLVEEGRTMRHCVGVYAAYVKRGESVIVGLNVCGHRSTVELDRSSPRILQHHGPSNSSPHWLCKRALDVCISRWRNPLLAGVHIVSAELMPTPGEFAIYHHTGADAHQEGQSNEDRNDAR